MAVAQACQGCKGRMWSKDRAVQWGSASEGSQALEANLLYHPRLRVPGGKCVSAVHFRLCICKAGKSPPEDYNFPYVSS